MVTLTKSRQSWRGQFYREYELLMAHWRRVLPGPFLEVDYEDLVTDLEVHCRQIIDFCGLDWNYACLNFHKNKRSVLTASQHQARQPLCNTSVHRWKNYEKHLAPLIRALKGDGTVEWHGGGITPADRTAESAIRFASLES